MYVCVRDMKGVVCDVMCGVPIGQKTDFAGSVLSTFMWVLGN